jgi:hypothetical protein
MKMSGNRIRFEMIIMVGGLPDAGEAGRTPRAAHESVPGTNARANNPEFVSETGMNKVLAIQTRREIPDPKIAPAATPAQTNPRRDQHLIHATGSDLPSYIPRDPLFFNYDTGK